MLLRRHIPLLLGLLGATALVACGAGSRAEHTTTALQLDLPERITDENAAEMRRLYVSLRPDQPARRVLRDRLLQHIDEDTEAVLARGDYEALVRHFERMASLLEPDDFGAALPAPMGRVATALVEAGSRRGDEARVLAALRVLRGVEDRDELRQQYEEIVAWGRDARAQLPTGFERYTGLLRVWDEHARLSPAPEVLQTLAQLHVERRDAVLEAFRDGPETLLRMGPMTTQVMRLAPLDVAAVYLRFGDVASAVTHLRALADGGQTTLRLLELLEQARGDGEEAADALAELGEAYREARPQTGRGVCLSGLRRFPRDARFPTCLARLSADAGQFDDATAWYVAAIDRAPDVRGLYDEALQRIDEFLAREVVQQDAAPARALAHRAKLLLDQRTRRFPGVAPPVPVGRIELLVGLAEMHAGNADEAKAHLLASLESEESSQALVELGILEERTGNPEQALRYYRRALDRTPNDRPSDRLARATILEHLGDAYAAMGNASQAERMYRQSLQVWDALAAEVGEGPAEVDEGPVIARIALRRGILLDRLGRREEALASFRQAMTADPQARDIYATILAHLVASQPDLGFAQEVFRWSQRQLALEPEWKVYFALWVKVVAARAGGTPADDVVAVLREQADANGWSGKLARFGVGDLPYGELLRAAGNPGEETEAHFYEAARRLEAGDQEGARALLERVLQTRMVEFYEYTMARALLGAR